jgi:hypothetical protein
MLPDMSRDIRIGVGGGRSSVAVLGEIYCNFLRHTSSITHPTSRDMHQALPPLLRPQVHALQCN